MSALGDYIHYYKRNYFSYGLNQTEGPRKNKNINIKSLISNKRRELGSSFQIKENDRFKQEYQNALNYLFGAATDLTPEQLKAREEDELKQAFYELVKNEFPNTIIEYSSLKATGGIENYNNILKKINPNDPSVSFGTIKNKIQALENLFSSQKILAQYSEQQINEKLKLLKKVQKTEKQLYDQLVKTGIGRKKGYITMKHADRTFGFGMNLRYANKTQRTFISELNELIHFFNGMNKSAIHGRLGELGAAVAGAKMTGVAMDQLAQFLDKSIVGKFSSSSTYMKTNFSKSFVDMQKLATTGWRYDEGTGNVTVSKPTQDKVDVQIETNEDIKYLSVKNYNLKGGNVQLSLVSGMSLLTMIQNETQDDFINHYLNITSSRTNPSEKDSTIAFLKADRIMMHDMMKEIILIKALTGLNIQKTIKNGTLKNMNVAKYFVVNDNSQPGFFKIFSISDLLDFSDLKNYKQGLSKYATINGYDSPEWENEGSDAKVRISKIMLQLHQTKLYAFASSKMLLNRKS